MSSFKVSKDLNPNTLTNASGGFVANIVHPTMSIDKDILYPGKSIGQFPFGFLKNTPDSPGSSVGIFNTRPKMPRYKEQFSIIPISFWRDGSIKHASIFFDIINIQQSVGAYSLEWYPIPKATWLYDSAFQYWEDCSGVDCNDNLPCLMICNWDSDTNTSRYFFTPTCDSPCCQCSPPDELLDQIGKECPVIGEGYAFRCDPTYAPASKDANVRRQFGVKYPTYFDMRLYTQDNGYVLEDELVNINLYIDNPIFNSGIYYIRDTNGNVYTPVANNSYSFLAVDSYLCSYMISGVLSDGVNTIASFITNIQHSTRSNTVDYSHTVVFEQDMRNFNIAEHSLVFSGEYGIPYTKNFNSNTPFNYEIFPEFVKVNIWPTGLGDSNLAIDYSGSNIKELRYLHKGSGGIQNFTMPTGYYNSLSGLGIDVTQVNFSGMSFNIDFSINLSTGLYSYIYQGLTDSYTDGRVNTTFSGNTALGQYGTHLGDFQFVDNSIASGIMSLLKNQVTSGWNSIGILNNNYNNILATAWKYADTTNNTVLFSNTISGSRAFFNNNFHKSLINNTSLGFSTNVLGIGDFQTTGLVYPDVLLYSKILDDNIIHGLGYEIFMNNWIADASLRISCLPVLCSGGYSMLLCDADTNTYVFNDVCLPCCSSAITASLTGLIGSPCNPIVNTGYMIPCSNIDWISYYTRPFSNIVANELYQKLLYADYYHNSILLTDCSYIINGILTQYPSGLTYSNNILNNQEWLSLAKLYLDDIDDFIIDTANNFLSGSFDGKIPLTFMALAYDITLDSNYLKRYCGWAHQQKYNIYNGPNSQYRGSGVNLIERNSNHNSWLRFKNSIQKAGWSISDIPLETGTYPNGMKVYVNNTGLSSISDQLVRTYWVGESGTTSNLNIRQSLGPSDYLISDMATFSSPESLIVNLRTSTWTEYQETCTGLIPTGISQIWSDGMVSLYYPITPYPEVGVIPQTGQISVSLCSGSIQPYSGSISGTFTCVGGSNSAHGYVEIGTTGIWLLPGESTGVLFNGLQNWMVNCQDGSYINAVFSGNTTPNIALFGSTSNIAYMLPLVSGLDF